MSLMAFQYSTPSGVVGAVTRPLESFVDTVMTKAATPFTAYGYFGEFDANGLFVPVKSSTTTVDGLLVRSAPSIAGDTGAVFNGGTPNVTMPQSIMRRGYASVACTIGTPVKGGVVYVRVVAATGKAIGDIEATADASNNVALAGIEWAVNNKDANGVSEIIIKGL